MQKNSFTGTASFSIRLFHIRDSYPEMFNFALPKLPHNVRHQVMKQYANEIDFLQQSVYGDKVIRLLCSDANTLRTCAHESASVRLRSQAVTDRLTDLFDGHILGGGGLHSGF